MDDYFSGANASATTVATDAAGQIFVAGSISSSQAGVRTSSDHGATWSAPLDTHAGVVRGIAVDATGSNLFTVGSHKDASGANLWLVRRSQDGGQTWSTVDQFSLGGSLAEAKAVTMDASGNVYVVGSAWTTTQSQSSVWIVRRSQDGGSTWSTTDSFSTRAVAADVFVSPTAGIFVVGSTVGGTKNQYTKWVVRRSQDGGNSWVSVDNFQLAASQFAYAEAVGTDAAGNLYVAGDANNRDTSGPLYSSHWVVRKSTNGGATWSTVDNFQLQTNVTTHSTGFGKDASGNLYVVGSARLNYSDHWLVRESAGGTGAWSTIDDFQAPGGQGDAAAIAADSFGGVYVAGSDSDSTGSQMHWIVRSTTSAAAPVASPAISAAAPALATFSATTIAGSPVQTSSQTGPITPESPTFSDGSRLTDQLFDKPAKKTHAHGR